MFEFVTFPKIFNWSSALAPRLVSFPALSGLTIVVNETVRLSK